jgi:hypothetical protein
MKMHLSFAIPAIVLVASCSSQESALRSAQQFGCKISPEHAQELVEDACGQLASGAAPVEMNSTGLTADDRMQEQNSARTETVSGWIKMPNGEVAAEGECEINTEHRKVIYAHITRGPTTQEEADYLRGLGACDQ